MPRSPGTWRWPARAVRSLILLLVALVLATCSRGRPEEDPAHCAVLVALTMNSPPDAYQLWGIARALGPAKAKEAARVLAHAVRVAERETDTFQRVLSLPEAAGICVAIGRKEEALRLLSRALAEAPKIDDSEDEMRALLSIADAYSDAGERETALRLLSRALAEAPKIDDWEGQMVALHRIAHVYSGAGQREAALRVLRQVPPDPSNRRGYRTMCEASSVVGIALDALRAGDKARALELLSQAWESARGVGGAYWRADALLAVVFGFAECGELDRALRIALQMEEEDKTGHRGLAKLAEMGEVRLAPVRYKFMALVRVAIKHADLGDLERAREVLSHAHGVAARVPARYRFLKSQLMKDVALAYAGAGEYRGDIILPRKAHLCPHVVSLRCGLA